MMKFLSIVAAASFALAPALAPAGTLGNNALGDGSAGTGSKSAGDTRPISGPVAGHYLKDEEVPVGAIVAGGLVILGGVVIGILAGGGGSDSNNNTNPPPN
jgi:hypothetical protein